MPYLLNDPVVKKQDEFFCGSINLPSVRVGKYLLAARTARTNDRHRAHRHRGRKLSRA